MPAPSPTDQPLPSCRSSTPSSDTVRIDSFRYERFGGILSCQNPPFLAWVDKNFMRSMGCAPSPLWEKPPAHLSAPTEVHLAVTNRCEQGCHGCYMDSRCDSGTEMSTQRLMAVLSMLKSMGVFHVALGGGEAFLRDDFEQLVRHCREIGLVPNLTTSGHIMGAA